MILKDMQTDLEVINIQRTRIINHPEYYEPVIIFQNGWKNLRTKEIKWDKAILRKAQEK